MSVLQHIGAHSRLRREPAERLGPLRGDSGATLKARLGELLMFHGVTPMRGEAGQSPGSLSAQAS